MRPKPDHGEESYRGRGRLAVKRSVITGADSGIGRAVAIAYVGKERMYLSRTPMSTRMLSRLGGSWNKGRADA
jgi:hypothetical protein